MMMISLLSQLHWLPVVKWIKFKIATLAYQSVAFGQPIISLRYCNESHISLLYCVPLRFTYYQFASCQLVITRNYFRRSAIGSAYLGPIALSWAFPYWRHRHFDRNPVCWNPSAVRSDLIYFSCKLFNIPRIDLYVSVYCSIIRT